jgi:hypothetical protein
MDLIEGDDERSISTIRYGRLVVSSRRVPLIVMLSGLSPTASNGNKLHGGSAVHRVSEIELASEIRRWSVPPAVTSGNGHSQVNASFHGSLSDIKCPHNRVCAAGKDGMDGRRG